MKIKEVNQHSKFSILIIFLLILSDIVSFYYSHKIVLLRFDTPSIIDYPIIIILGVLFLFYFFKCYNPSSLQSRIQEVKIIVVLTCISTFLYLIYKIGLNYITIQQSQHIVFLTILFMILVIIFRLFIRTTQKQLLKYNIGVRNVIILANRDKGYNLLSSLYKKKYLGYKVVGYFYSDECTYKEEFISRFNLNSCIFLHIDNVEDFINNSNIKDVIISLESKESKKTINIISNLRNLDVCIKVVPDMYDILTGYSQMHSVTGMPLIEINPNILTELQVILKRIIDIFVSFFGLIAISPILIFIAILIKLTSKGPVIFKQERVGLNGASFIVHKFRTMYIDSEKDTGPVWAKKNDSRITFIGNILRRTRLDEFPQLFDVFIGNMSIVGPRPEREFFIEQLKHKFPYYVRRLKVRPGITGWAQIMGSYDTDLDNVEHKLKLDFYYIENISIWLDVKIMIITIWVILSGKGQ